MTPPAPIPITDEEIEARLSQGAIPWAERWIARIRDDAETIQRLRAERNTEMLGSVGWQEKLKIAEEAIARLSMFSDGDLVMEDIARIALAKIRCAK